jgi:hypothetical protein
MDSFRRKSWGKSFRNFIHWASLLLCASPLGVVVPAPAASRQVNVGDEAIALE